MPQRITEDPNRAQTPDYGEEEWTEVVAALTVEGRTEEEAKQLLVNKWRANLTRKKERWARQQEEDEEARRQQEEGDRRAAEELRRQEEDEVRRKEEHNKRRDGRPSATPAKRKLNPLVQGMAVSDTRIPRPSSYALNKLAKYQFIELWYFTEQGCEDAFHFDHTAGNDTYTLATSNDVLSLEPVKAVKASRNAIADDRLTWRQMSVAKTWLLHWMTAQGWPTGHVHALASFYVALENHPIRRERHGDQALLLYQAEVRREWFDTLTPDHTQEAFDIGIINESRLRKIDHARYVVQRDLAVAQWVNVLCLTFYRKLTIPPCFLAISNSLPQCSSQFTETFSASFYLHAPHRTAPLPHMHRTFYTRRICTIIYGPLVLASECHAPFFVGHPSRVVIITPTPFS